MNTPAGTVGRLDRAVRFLLGLVLLGFAFICPFAQSLGGVVVWGSGIVGAVLAITAVVGICPLYRILGLHT